MALDKTENRKKQRELSGITRSIAFGVGIFLTVLIFYTAFMGVLLPIQQRSIALCLFLALTFFWIPASRRSPLHRPSIFDYVLVIFSLSILAWTLYSHPRYLTRITYYSEMHLLDIIFGLILIVMVLEAGRRTIGLTVISITGIFIFYSFAGPYMPGMLAHPGTSFIDFIDFMYLTRDGLFGSLVGLTATVLFAFVAFGTFLQGTNADKYFMNIALGLVGRSPGGPAKVSVLSSAAMGMISGSTIANIVTTGTLTIPLMKRSGFSAEEAAAIETVASSGGQISPPIMGAAAFLIAEFIGVEYFKVVQVSFIPAIVFYCVLWFFVDFISKKKEIKGLQEDELPDWTKLIKESIPLFIPLFILIWMLVYNFTPFLSGVICTLLIYAMSIINKNTRISLKKLFVVIEKCSINMISIAAIIACAAIIVGLINTTGLMIKSTSIILKVSGGSLVLTVLIEALIAIVLGMGLPAASCYIILSTLGAPALIELGINPIASHLMIFWFAQLAGITPPVCISAFVAASVAEASPMRTGFASLKMGSSFYIVPILFIFTNIIDGSISSVMVIGLLAIFGFYFFIAGIEGYYLKKMNYFVRFLCISSSIMIILATFNLIHFNIKMMLIAISLFIIVCMHLYQRKPSTPIRMRS